MEELKSLFGDGSLSYEEFEQKLGEASESIKLANLQSGRYVDKDKCDKLEKSVNDWQTKFKDLSEKTKDYDDLKAKYDTLNANYEQLQQKQDEADKMAEIANANVNPKFAKFVYSEVNSQVSDGKTFQTVLTEYLKDNSQFLKNGQGTYANLENGTTPPKSANQKMNDFIRSKL